MEFGYSQLKDLRLEVEAKDEKNCFCFGFWVYLLSFTSFPSTILVQMHSEAKTTAPLLVLNKEKKLVLFPSRSLDVRNPDSGDSISSKVVCSVASEAEFLLEKWVHVGCEISSSLVRLHVDGKISGERTLDFEPRKESDSRTSRTVISAPVDGDGERIKGYVHNAKLLPISCVKDHHIGDPPLQLSIDSSSASEIEEDSDGVWSIVGGKSSCRRIFSVDVILSNGCGAPVDKEMEVVASLAYADDQTTVGNTDDDEAPLLISYDGTEFPASDKPSKLLQGRASFKLKISQLSSKCENRLFRVKFSAVKFESYPFLEARSRPIRCISRNRNAKVSTITWKKLPSGVHLVNGSSSPTYGNGHPEPQQNGVCEVRPSPSSKRVKLGRDTAVEVAAANVSSARPDEECNSYARMETKVQNVLGTSLEGIRDTYGSMDNSASDSESVGARYSDLKSITCREERISDIMIFKYCLGGLSERSHILKDIALFSSDQDMADFAEQVSFFSGCSHHRHQILIAKGLLEEGEKAWSLISQNRDRVNWENVIFEIEEQFLKISCCTSRSLTQQDLNFLKKISGCDEYMTRENFDRMWQWVYPVAFTISRDGINSLWGSTMPRWIAGFLTKEEVEYTLQSSRGTQEPGTFMLRFPTSRSWPHPDGGSLVVTYVGRDYALHHRQLSLDYSSGILKTNSKPLQELLLSEPELSRLARIPSNLAT